MNTYDVIIIGAGPAGLTAAIYALRAKLKTLIIEDPSTLSQAGYAAFIENFPGFPEGISGAGLIQNEKKQVIAFGAEIVSAKVKSIESVDQDKQEMFSVVSDGSRYEALLVIVASGASAKMLGVIGENRLSGKGVSYCAICDGLFFRDKRVAVVGGGDSAIEEALFLTKFASRVYIIHRRNALRAVKILQDKALSNKKIEIIWDSVVEEILGNDKVSGIKLRNVLKDTLTEVECEGVFVSIGHTPNTDFINDIADLDKDGYIKTDRGLNSSRIGIFACGDCRDTNLRQIVTACGDGALAGVSCQKYLDARN